MFDDTMDVNVKGTWLSCRAVIPHMVANGGGSIIITSSVAGTRPMYRLLHYGTSKHAVIGIMRNLAVDLAPSLIRVNAVLPGVVLTPMTENDMNMSLFAGKESGGTLEEFRSASETVNVLPRAWAESIDISNAVLWLASDEARCVTGVALAVDNGQSIQPSGVPPLPCSACCELKRPLGAWVSRSEKRVRHAPQRRSVVIGYDGPSCPT